MDDFSLVSLKESRNEWCIQLIQKLSPAIVAGLATIFTESFKLCTSTNEQSKYLMTFQNFLARIPKWNTTIVEKETTLIIESSGCAYLGDLLTCVHIIILKALTCVRVGIKQKKIDIDIPPLHKFIHSVYILVARKIYTNIYLYEQNLSPLQTQQHNYQIEQIINECILNAVRESIPVDSLLRAYMDESVEEEIIPIASILRSYLDETSETVDLSPETIIRNKLDTVLNTGNNSGIETTSPEAAATRREGDVSGTDLGVGLGVTGVDVGVETVFKTNELVTVPVIEPSMNNLMITPQQPVNMNAHNEIKNVSFEDDSGLKIGDDVKLSHYDVESIGQDEEPEIEFTNL